jgi:hypothetical protein
MKTGVTREASEAKRVAVEGASHPGLAVLTPLQF